MAKGWQIALGVAGGLAGVGLARRYLFERASHAQIDALLGQAAPPAPDLIEEADLEGLPEPVQRYLRFAGVVGRRPVRTVRLRHSGEFRLGPDKPWMPMEATEFYATAPPAFLWRASMRLAPLVHLEVRDAFAGGRGQVNGTLAGAVPIVEADGPQVDQGAAVRYLQEMVFFPTAFLADYVQWEPIDEHRARLVMNHWDGDITAQCVFADDGRMLGFSAQRYYGAGGPEATKRTWTTPLGHWTKVDGLQIPTVGSGYWTLDDGDFDYVRIRIEDVEYDPEPPRHLLS